MVDFGALIDVKLIQQCDALTDKAFKALPEPAQNWINEAIAALKQKKPIPWLATELRDCLKRQIAADNPKHLPQPKAEVDIGRVLTGEPYKFENGYSYEMDQNGWFRIADPEGKGEWTHYAGLAFSADGQFFAVSSYFGTNGAVIGREPLAGLKAETLYRFEEIKRSS